MRKFLLAAVAAALCISPHVNAAIITQYTFETTGPITPEVQNPSHLSFGSATTSGGTNASNLSNPAGNGSAKSFSSNGWDNGEAFKFTFDATGLTDDLVFSFEQGRSSTGPADWTATAIVGSDTYTLGTYTLTNATFNSSTYNAAFAHSFTLPTSQHLGSSNITFNIVCTTTGTIAAAGTSRIDNVTIATAASIPEPYAIGILGLGVLLLRRKHA